MYWTGSQDNWVQLPGLTYSFDLPTLNVTGSAISEASLVGIPVAERTEFFP